MRRQRVYRPEVQERSLARPGRRSSPVPAARDEVAAIVALAGGVANHGQSDPAASADRQALRAIQRTLGNAAAGEWVQRRTGTAAASPRGHAIQRDGPPTTDPSLETPQPADLTGSGKELVMKYAEKYLGRLSDEAKKRLADAWDESPGGVIAAGAVIGGAGVAYLVGTKSALPGLPAIPLDVLGGPFVGATIELQIGGPVTSPESFGFKITFSEQAKKRRKHSTTKTAPNIYTYANPEVIAQQVDGPAFETQVPDADSDTNLSGANLANLVRIIGNGMLDGASRKDTRPYVDLGELPPTPPEFVDGLKRIVDALVAAAPGPLGTIEQVNFRIYRAGKLRFIPIRPSPPQGGTDAGDAAK